MDEALWLASGIVLGAGVAVLVLRRAAGSLRRELAEQTAASERERLQRARSQREDRAVQELVLDSMEEGVLLLDGDGAKGFSNDALARHLGTVPDHADAILPLGIRAAVARAAEGAVARADVELGHPPRWLQATALPVGEDGGVLLVVRDVTEARRLDAVRRDFVANASHELKTPVASIRAAAETLRHGALQDPPAAERFSEQLERESIRLSRIVSDLLDLSRLEAGSERQELVHLDALVREETERSLDDARAAGVSVAVDAASRTEVWGSPRDLALLVRNLVDNAISYTPAGGAVTVRVGTEGDRVALRVSDTGIGIPGRDLPRVFERFYRVDRARSRDTGGTGLGLAIVKHVAENHGGSVSVQSELGAGTTFAVSLPRGTGADPGPAS
jgi:two-component system phosphate regulon sensor histidine kinase PhoR